MRKLLFSILLLIISALMCLGGYVTLKGYNYYKEALDQKSLEEMAAQIRSSDSYTPIDEMPEMYKDAVVATEDKRFYHHGGIDPVAIARAVYHDLLAGSFVEGGSTITQQLAKNQYFSQEKDITRKIAEVFMAIDMEKAFTKDEILELYLNSIYFGSGYYGIAEASMGYFGKEPSQMNEDECTLLAGVPNAPSVYAPDTNPELARQRQAQVIQQMIQCGYFPDTTVNAVLAGFQIRQLNSTSSSLKNTPDLWGCFFTALYCRKVLTPKESKMQDLASSREENSLLFNIWATIFPMAVASVGPAYTVRPDAFAVRAFR